jgi:hypothetical protein
MVRPLYETDKQAFPADAYSVKRYQGVAFQVYGWQIERGTEWVKLDDEDSEAYVEEEYERRTGMVVVVMIGDDTKHVVDPSDLTAIAREDYCGECGQVGCQHDGLDRE